MIKSHILAVLAVFCWVGIFAQTSTQTGIASYYSDNLHGNLTAYGERYDKNEHTCASLKYKHNDLLEVTRLDNDMSVIVRVNDKGPFKATRIIDLSRAAAKDINLIQDGLARVKVRLIDDADAPLRKPKKLNPPIVQDNPLPDAGTPFDGEKISGSYLVQMGAFSSKKSADDFTTQLKQDRLSAIRIVKRKVGNRNLYSVGAGPFEDKTDADNHKAYLNSLGHDCFVIRI